LGFATKIIRKGKQGLISFTRCIGGEPEWEIQAEETAGNIDFRPEKSFLPDKDHR
jgi:hypothetical protein